MNRHKYNFLLEWKVIKKLCYVWIGLIVIGGLIDYSVFKSTLEHAMTQAEYEFDSETGTYVKSPDYRFREDELPYGALRAMRTEEPAWSVAIAMIGIAIMGTFLIQRESFAHGWHHTLRRVPGYRGFYALGKEFPGALMTLVGMVVYIGNGLLCRGYYRRAVPKEVQAVVSYDKLGFAPGRMFCCMAICVSAVLMMNLAFRLLRRDYGFGIVALASIVVACAGYAGRIEMPIPAVCMCVCAGVYTLQVYRRL